MKSINIIFPVYNEERRLLYGVEKTYDFLTNNIKNSFVITIIDNASTDKTSEIGKELAIKYRNVKYIRINEKGVGAAFRKGILENTSGIVGYMDCDLSTSLEHLIKTIEYLDRDEADYINGSRFSKESHVVGRKWYRSLYSCVLIWILKIVLGMKSNDALCGFTFLKDEVAKELIDECSKDNGWFYTVEFLLRAERKNNNIKEIPVKWTENYDTTVKAFSTIVNYLLNIIRLKKTFIMEDTKNDKKK